MLETSPQIILTNNPLLLESNPEGTELCGVTETGLEAVLQKGLELAQSGYKLISAPLPPNVPLIRAPYRSLVLIKNSRQYDSMGIKALEKALERVRLLNADRAPMGSDQADDSAYIDRDLLKRALSECRLLQVETEVA
mgnify:CR=1 FL=1